MTDNTANRVKAPDLTEKARLIRDVQEEMRNLGLLKLFPLKYSYMTLERNGLCEHIIKLWNSEPVFKERWDEDELCWGCSWKRKSESDPDWCCLIRLKELPDIETKAIDSLMSEELSIFQACIIKKGTGSWELLS